MSNRVNDPKHSSIANAVIAPWRHLFRQGRAANIIAQSGLKGAVISSLFNWFVASCMLEIFFLAPILFNWQWADTYGWPIENWHLAIIPIPVLIGGSAFVLVLILAQLPLVYVTKEFRSSTFRAWSSIIACEAGLCLFVALILCFVHLWAYLDDIAVYNPQLRDDCEVIQLGGISILIMTLCWVFASLDRVGRVLLAATEKPINSVHCEACGYNLDSIALTGRCPECGADAAISLDDQCCRTGVAWEATLALYEFPLTNLQLVFRPSGFYRKLRMRADITAALSFASLNYFFAGVACSVVPIVLVRMTTLHLSAWQEAVRILLVGVVGLILFWIYHRLIGAVAGIVANLSGIVPDFERVRKIWLYESAFVWVVLVVQVIGLSLLLIYPSWFSDTVAFYLPAFVRDDLIPLMTGAFIFLSLLALYRYYRAIKITRWSNF